LVMVRRSATMVMANPVKCPLRSRKRWKLLNAT
jgi:hypothetical protein